MHINFKGRRYHISSVPSGEQTVCKEQLPSSFSSIKLCQGINSHIIEYNSDRKELVQPIILTTNNLSNQSSSQCKNRFQF